jgi:hypothetical protein
MTFFLNFRSQSVGGGVIEPRVLSGDGTADEPALRVIADSMIGSLVAGKNVLFVAHGFNVSYAAGARSLGQLDQYLNLGGADVLFGVLWPGDYWLPVVNYPFEGDVSMDCGRRLATFCKRYLAGAQSVSFASHSLGARLILEAVKNLDKPARSVCLTAAAINQDCLATEYALATDHASAISILSSHEDWVLKVAFQIGDPISILLHDDHSPFEPALGYAGPPAPAAPPVVPPWQIPDAADYGHGDYLPPGDAVTPVQTIGAAKWASVAGFMARAFRGQPQSWP